MAFARKEEVLRRKASLKEIEVARKEQAKREKEEARDEERKAKEEERRKKLELKNQEKNAKAEKKRLKAQQQAAAEEVSRPVGGWGAGSHADTNIMSNSLALTNFLLPFYLKCRLKCKTGRW